MPLSYKDVADIIRIIDASKLDEIIIEMDGAKMHIRRGSSGTATVVAPTDTADMPVQTPVPAPVSPKPAPVAQQLTGHTVRAPMVGVFYRAPSPKDPPFVEVGSIVKRDDPLCLIEVMKLFTTIAADRDGRITHILPVNGGLVEFDQVLFVIEPT